MSEPWNAADPAPPRPHGSRLRPYFDAWLLGTFLFIALSVIWSVTQAAEGHLAPGKIGGTFLLAPIVALLSLPAMWLLRLFPERSPSTWLRCLRRLVVGVLCGTFPASVLAALVAIRGGDRPAFDSAGMIWMSGLLFGLVSGLVDAMHADAVQAGAMHADSRPANGAHRDALHSNAPRQPDDTPAA